MQAKESAVVLVKDDKVGEILQKCLKGSVAGNNITEMIKKSLLVGVEAKI